MIFDCLQEYKYNNTTACDYKIWTETNLNIFCQFYYLQLSAKKIRKSCCALVYEWFSLIVSHNSGNKELFFTLNFGEQFISTTSLREVYTLLAAKESENFLSHFESKPNHDKLEFFLRKISLACLSFQMSAMA